MQVHSQARSSSVISFPVFTLLHKTPGKVMATVDGKRVLPTFKFAGASDFLKKCIRDRKQFDRDMTELFAVAGLGGEFHCSVHRPVKGNFHIKGLRLRSHSHGVLIEANYGGTNDILEISVVAPNDNRDPMKFLDLLKKGQEALGVEEEEETLSRRASYGRAGDHNFHAEKEVFDSRQRPVSRPPASLLAPPGATPRIEKPEVVPRAAPFYKDMTMLALFMSELEKHATQDGMVTRTNCINILMKEFSIKGVSTGAVLRGIIGDGHLFEATSGDELLRFGEMWLTAWLNKGRTAESVAPTVPEGGTILIGDLLSIDKLTDEAQRLRLRREELETSLGVLQPKATQMKAELLVLEPKVVRMKAELEELETQTTSSQRELDEILAELRDPKYAKAECDLTLLQKLLGKKI